MGTLRAHQIESAAYLERSTRAYLADEMRVGKTPPACVAAARLGVRRPVIFCPAIAKQIWEEAWPEWAQVKVPSSAFPRIVSYDKLIRTGYGQFLDNDLLILDEAHYCRNTHAKRTKAALGIANRSLRVWLLSGSPMPSSPLDLYAPLRAIWPDELRKANAIHKGQFLDQFCSYYIGEYGLKVTGAKNVPLLQDILSRVMPFRRTFMEVAGNVPPLQWEMVELDAGAPDLLLESSALSEETIALLDQGELPADGTAQWSTVRRLLGEMKAPAAAGLIASELRDCQYERVVVLAHHRSVMDVLETALSGFGVCRVDGDTSEPQRYALRRLFQGGERQVFLGQIQTVGLSIDLSAAHHIVFVEQSTLPDENTQAAMRIMNINRERPAYARMLFADTYIDRQIRKALRRRMTAQGEIFNR
jgi:SNF2 family DNA or RNA helicase